jgi:hypothetical protein
MDAVLSSYAERPGRRIKEATIVEIDGWRSGADPTPALERLFEARDALAFSALADRRLFSRNFGYCSFDTFALVVQRFSSNEPSRFAYTTRRRDGGTHNLWSADEFAFHQPLHVHKALGLTCDEKLLAMLLDSRNEVWSNAISEFNRANTDSPDVPLHVEMIMVKSAFERLFEIGSSWQVFERAVLAKVGDAAIRRKMPAPLAEKWSERWPRATRPIAAWAHEFCVRRGSAAHGVERASERLVWSEGAHLAFAAILFPLMLRKTAADAGKYVLAASDAERLRRVDEYVTCDPFSSSYDRVGREPHPWNLIDDECRAAEIVARLPPWSS